MYARLLDIDVNAQESILLLGPRGTGKTSWLKTHFKESLYLDLLDSQIRYRLLADPSALETFIPPNFKEWIIIDEVQKAPELLNEVHRLIEHKGYKFILTGSSARSLKRKGVNLLAGRALDYRMHPLTINELGDDFSLEKNRFTGFLPSACLATDATHYLATYVHTYLQEEILQEGLVRNLNQFARFLEVASFSQGSVINFSQISREVGIDRKIVSAYFDILDDLLIGIRLPVFSKRSKRKLVVQDKFYFFDVGVYHTIRPLGPLDSPELADGPLLETIFLQHLHAINDYYRLGFTIYYWRTYDQFEVDFIVYGNKGLIGFKIKRKSSLSSKDFSGLKSFSRDYPEAKLFLVYGGKQKEYHGQIQVIPFEEALKNLLGLLTSSSSEMTEKT